MQAPTPYWVEGSPSFTFNADRSKLTVAGVAYCEVDTFWDAAPTGKVSGTVTLGPPLNNSFQWGDTVVVDINRIRETGTENAWLYKAEFSKELTFVGNETGIDCVLKFLGKHNNVDTILSTPNVAMPSG